jgi:hypothetical protein
MATHRIVGRDTSIDEVEGPGVAILVLRLEMVPWEVCRCGGRADAHIRQKSILGDVIHGLQRASYDIHVRARKNGA